MADERDIPVEATDRSEGPEQRSPEHSREIAVRPLAGSLATAWRRRAVSLRSALPQLARNPVVVGASAAAATVAVRVALEVARRAVTASVTGATGSAAGPAPARPLAVDVRGSIVHEVRVVRHVHVVQHTVHHVVNHTSAPLAYWTLPPGPPRP